MQGTRIRLKFAKTGPLTFISHLDLLRTMERAIRRSELPIAYSEGFNPRAKIQFASALPLGVESKGELVDLELKVPLVAREVQERLEAQLPPGFEIKVARAVENEAALMSLIQGARYLVQVESAGDLLLRTREWLKKIDVPWVRQQKRKARHFNLRPQVGELEPRGENWLELLLFFSQEAINVRPEEVILSLELVPLKIIRMELYGQGVLLTPLEKGKM